MFHSGKGRNHLKKAFQGQLRVKVQSRMSCVPSLCMEVGGNNCIFIQGMASLPVGVAHSHVHPWPCTYCPEAGTRSQAWLVLGTFLHWANLLSPSPAVTRGSFLAWGIPWDAAAPWACLCTSRQAFAESSWIWCTQAGMTPHGSSLVQSRRAIPVSILSLPWAKQIMPEVPCKMCFTWSPLIKQYGRAGLQCVYNPLDIRGEE